MKKETYGGYLQFIYMITLRQGEVSQVKRKVWGRRLGRWIRASTIKKKKRKEKKGEMNSIIDNKKIVTHGDPSINKTLNAQIIQN